MWCGESAPAFGRSGTQPDAVRLTPGHRSGTALDPHKSPDAHREHRGYWLASVSLLLRLARTLRAGNFARRSLMLRRLLTPMRVMVALLWIAVGFVATQRIAVLGDSQRLADLLLPADPATCGRYTDMSSLRDELVLRTPRQRADARGSDARTRWHRGGGGEHHRDRCHRQNLPHGVVGGAHPRTWHQHPQRQRRTDDRETSPSSRCGQMAPSPSTRCARST